MECSGEWVMVQRRWKARLAQPQRRGCLTDLRLQFGAASRGLAAAAEDSRGPALTGPQGLRTTLIRPGSFRYSRSNQLAPSARGELALMSGAACSWPLASPARQSG